MVQTPPASNPRGTQREVCKSTISELKGSESSGAWLEQMARRYRGLTGDTRESSPVWMLEYGA